MTRLSRRCLAVPTALLLLTGGVRAQDGPIPVSPNELGGLPSPAWKGALADSLRLLLLEHSVRIATESKTRRELGGPFLRDYVRSVRLPKTWSDGDGWLRNYVGHPVHGAAAGFIWLDHVEGAHDRSAGFSGDYWRSRARATAWAAAYSVQFEFGPFSEASIGNVGLRPGTTGWVDHVVTPVGAFGLMVLEDAIDRHVIAFVEARTKNRVMRAVVRSLFTPGRSLSNVAQARAFWHRPDRPLR